MPLFHALALCLLLTPQSDEKTDPVLAAYQAFEKAPGETQVEIVRAIYERVEQSDEETLKGLRHNDSRGFIRRIPQLL